MRRLLRWIIGAPIIIIVMIFAVVNRQWVTLSLDPFNETNPAYSLEIPVWLLVFFGIFIGIIVGWFYCWRAQGKWRKLARERQVEITRLRNELMVNPPSPTKVDTQMLAPLPGFMP